ncbi:MAG: hypothetical protein ACRC5R_03455 [Mycoplasmatales bacterium]
MNKSLESKLDLFYVDGDFKNEDVDTKFSKLNPYLIFEPRFEIERKIIIYANKENNFDKDGGYLASLVDLQDINLHIKFDVNISVFLTSFIIKLISSKKKVKNLNIITKQKVNIDKINAIVKNCIMACELIDMNHIELNPNSYEKYVKNALLNKDVSINIIKDVDLLKNKLVGLEAVGRSSKYGARMIKLSYENGNENIALIGKGVTFDTGGMNVKTGNRVGEMRVDMAGSALMFSLFKTIVDLELEINVDCYLPVTQNHIGHEMYLPGEVLEYPNGVKVEVGNTDAEGRLILADALCMTNNNEYDIIIDMATLTGSAGQALSDEVASIFGSKEFSNLLIDKSLEYDEYLWHMPSYDIYKKFLKTDIADINNVAIGGESGVCVAAVFLKQFINDPNKWVHVDLSGTVFSNTNHYIKTGKPVFIRPLLDLIIEKYNLGE